MSRARGREDAAHRYADAGWRVFPAEPGGKRPIPEHGYLDATTGHRQIQHWWRAEPRSNVAIATGAPGPDVLDVDRHKDGDGFAAFNRLKQAGLVREPMAIIRTPSGGFHAYYQGTGHQRNGHIPGVYVDFRSQGGYVVAPPSTIAGRTYEVAQKQASADTFDWAAAKQLLDPQPQRQPYRAPERTADGPRDVSHLAAWVAAQPEGNRNAGLYWAANRAIEAGDTATLDSLANAARAAGLDEREIGRTIASAQQAAGRGRPFEHLPVRVTSAAAQPYPQAEAEAGALRPWPASGPVMACHRPTGP
jgi:Bifunctional DNA primase/polymerase, N-terminal